MREPLSFGRGAVTDADWKALVWSLREAVEGWCAPIMEGPTLFLEVGTLSGKTTRGIYDVLKDAGWETPHVITIDKDPKRAGVLDRFRDGEYVGFFPGTARQWVEDSGERFLWAFLDGCHCEDCVRDDIAVLAPFCVPGGYMCFHDAGHQRSLGMKVHQRYHGDGVTRPYGVSEAIAEAPEMQDFILAKKVPPRPRPEGPTPVFGGLQIWRKNEDF